MSDNVWLVSAVRTPIGSFRGSLATMQAPELAATAVREGVARTGLQPDRVDEVIMGNVVSAGVGQNPARQATLGAGLPVSVGATTVNKVCGSGLKAVMLAYQSIRLGQANIVVAGGMESMSRAPYLLPQARDGYRMGNGEVVDSLIHDGLWDCYGNQHMGNYGELCAEKYGFSKQDQDDFAVRSYTRARTAAAEGAFEAELVPVEVKTRRSTEMVAADEEPQRFNEEKLRQLRPAFAKEGTITAGNASSINDGAAALVAVSDAELAGLNTQPIARVVGMATFSTEPQWFTTAPIGSMQRLMEQLDWSVDSTDLFEVNEAFAAVAMVAQRELGIPDEKLNIHGGAVALGHPIGCSGARILVTLVHALKRSGGRRGIASLCIGGGEAVALAVEVG